MTVTVDRLNGFLGGQFSVPEDIVVLSPLTDAEGKPADAARNRLAFFITNITEDTVPRRGHARGGAFGGLSGEQDPVHLDIYAMLAASYDANIYAEGLKMLSAALMYFQTFPVLTPQNTPEMPNGIQQLSFEISNLKPEEMGQMWGNFGGRYVPSVMFKIRSVSLVSGAIKSIIPTIRKPSASANPDRGRGR
ncbi:DUF4255 domain-containing protein [Yoonia sp.]|uniref:DUF4255 domain-containing protein n=1 Tax=Yoonia sp. TaxID=2212373 RepID=UPI0025E11395|nr:DUF4255 domain-containing protein [Yoonia sp.]